MNSLCRGICGLLVAVCIIGVFVMAAAGNVWGMVSSFILFIFFAWAHGFKKQVRF